MNREEKFLAAHAATHDRIFDYLRRRTDNAATAEDLCADVFRIAWEKSDQRDGLSVMVLFGVAKNVLRNHARSTSRSESLQGALRQEWRNESETTESPVYDAIDRLSPEDREVLFLSYWEGLSSAEISELLNISAAAVRMRLHRARKALSNVIQNQAEPEGAKK